MSKLTIYYAAPEYSKWTLLEGGKLSACKECYALMHYAITARHIYDMHENPNRVRELEGEHNQEVNYRELFKSIALVHGVEPGEMLHFWSHVDAQFHLLGIPCVPHSGNIRQVH